ncbi:MAG: hypothetical protein KDH96_10545 [Candidatus Riesia sp.]|nr:hypothetical protein [Candidatus Riesia sp.]
MKIVVLENIKDIINCNGWSGIMVNLVGKEYDVYTETRVQFYDKYGNHIDKKAVTIIRYDGKIDNYWVIPEGYYEIVDDEEEWDDISDGLFDSYNPKYINFFEDVNIDPFEEENWEESEFTKEDIISLENIKNMINDDNNYHIKKVGIGKFDGKEVYCNYLYNHKNDMWDQDYLVICILYNEKYSHKDGYEYDFTSISNENNNMKNGITVNGIIVDLYDNFLSIIENGMKEKESIEYNDMINRYKKLDIILRNKNNLSWEEKMKSKLISHELYKSVFGISKTHFYDDYMDMKRMGEHEWNDYNKRKSKIALDIFKEIKDDELFDSYDSKYIKFFENNSDDRFVINNDKFE